MCAIAGLSALGVFWVVLPVIDVSTGQRRAEVVPSQGASPKGDLFPGIPREVKPIRRHVIATTQDLGVSLKGDFLGWFPETGNLELEFKITQTENPLAFERPSYTVERPSNAVPSTLERSTTRLVAFANAPFPFRGREPRSNRPFLTTRAGERVHVTGSGRVYQSDKTYGDPRALVHIPKGFDIKAPGVMVVFFHGHGATLRRDVYKRQRVPHQVSESGVNAVLVAPQFAVDARDSSAGKLWEKGGLRRFLDEAAIQLAREHGAPGARRAFANMPVVIVAYSGGFEPAAWSVSRGGLGDRLKGLVLLDALYGHVDRFAHWIGSDRSAFLINAYAGGSPQRNSHQLKSKLQDRGIAVATELDGQLRPGSVTFLPAVTSHRHYVNRAWTKNPIADMLRRLRFILGDPPQHLSKVAATQKPG